MRRSSRSSTALDMLAADAKSAGSAPCGHQARRRAQTSYAYEGPRYGTPRLHRLRCRADAPGGRSRRDRPRHVLLRRMRPPRRRARVPTLRADVRDVTTDVLEGYDGIVHLAALSNDPLGELNEELTREINLRGTVELARKAKEAGARRFVFASSCSMYGASGTDELMTEDAPLRPLTAYAESKVRAEEQLSELADADFAPIFLRNATAYGASPRVRLDVVLNNLAAWAFTTGKVLIMSDGTPWRPLVHVRDIAAATAAALVAPTRAVRNEAFNVGSNDENYRVRELAEIVRDTFAGTARSSTRRERAPIHGATASTFGSWLERCRTPGPGGRPGTALESCSTPIRRLGLPRPGSTRTPGSRASGPCSSQDRSTTTCAGRTRTSGRRAHALRVAWTTARPEPATVLEGRAGTLGQTPPPPGRSRTCGSVRLVWAAASRQCEGDHSASRAHRRRERLPRLRRGRRSR